MAGFKETNLGSTTRTIHDYKKFGLAHYRAVISAASKIEGTVIIHVSATPYGGGVAEILLGQVQLERSVNLQSFWFTFNASKRFFQTSKKMHNLLQGKSGSLTDEEKGFYLSECNKLGKQLHSILSKFNSGIVVIHDPQPLPFIRHIPQNFTPIFRLHIDVSTPNPTIINFLQEFILLYKTVILSSEIYRVAFPWLKKDKTKISYPAIDPLSEKNRPIPKHVAWSILETFGINPSKPLITQVSRFDPWKDPAGVIKAYYIAKNEIPNLQIALAGFMVAQDDPEAVEIYEKIAKHAEGDPDIHQFTDPKQLKKISNDSFINALFTASNIIIQKSIREGFGLTMTEAMWKEKPLIAGITTGALIQIQNRKNAILVTSPQDTGKEIVRLMKDEKLCLRLGKAAHQSVRRKFLLPRLLLDYLKIYTALVK